MLPPVNGCPQCLINDVLRDMLGKFIITYIENVLIYSSFLESHVAHVKQVLSCFLKNQLYVKGEKCEFYVPTVSFLGYIISQEGVAMDEGG